MLAIGVMLPEERVLVDGVAVLAVFMDAAMIERRRTAIIATRFCLADMMCLFFLVCDGDSQRW